MCTELVGLGGLAEGIELPEGAGVMMDPMLDPVALGVSLSSSSPPSSSPSSPPVGSGAAEVVTVGASGPLLLLELPLSPPPVPTSAQNFSVAGRTSSVVREHGVS